MPCGRAVDLAEVFQVIQGQLVAGEVQHAVEERRRVTAGEDEPVASSPVRVFRVVAHVPVVKQVSDRCRFHRCAGVSGLRLFDHVGGKQADGVDGSLGLLQVKRLCHW